ncbi:MAG: GIY-YIG nuclease family protein [Planctomycetota bacterium]
MWHLYIIKQREKFYTGITTDLKNRLHQHGNPPLLYKEHFQNKLREEKGRLRDSQKQRNKT